ncbi:hypothetical protein B0H63DRAFT_449557 [Podospora didyma]|uniref:Myb-like domain-containing protein n=1 Tax=Podospora didyma TaxID=330526 RepID=A0AAE0NPY3_9PEZI|nr:hypothetical protein B0H63DRAFT_449557 [Podospora didyma]
MLDVLAIARRAMQVVEPEPDPRHRKPEPSLYHMELEQQRAREHEYQRLKKLEQYREEYELRRQRELQQEQQRVQQLELERQQQEQQRQERLRQLSDIHHVSLNDPNNPKKKRWGPPWTLSEDQTLLALRVGGWVWLHIQHDAFPTKTLDACRKRHRNLVDMRSVEIFEKSETYGKVAQEYMSSRRPCGSHWPAGAERDGRMSKPSQGLEDSN